MSQEIMLTRDEKFRYLSFDPPIAPEVLANLPMPSEGLGCAVDAGQPCYVEEAGSLQTIGFGAWIFNREKNDKLLLKYAKKIAIHLGEAALDENVQDIESSSSLIEQQYAA